MTYDAAARSYTVSTAGRTQAFGPGDLDAKQSSAALKVFSKTTGSLSESLSLTQPGTSGRLTYQYVGSGFWQRTLRSASAVDFTFDAFTYGVKTPDAAVPRTGIGVFAIDLIGAQTGYGNSIALSGAGTLQTDFASGQITTSGNMQRTDVASGIPLGNAIPFGASAALSSSSNAFAGSFTFDDFGPFTGPMQGRFYGPAGQEVGASWSTSNADGRVAAGTIIGRRDPNASPVNQSLTSLVASQSFGLVPSAELSYVRTADGRRVQSTDFGGQPVPASGPTLDRHGFDYDATTKRYSYQSSSNANIAVGPENKVESESNGRVTVYEKMGTNPVLPNRVTLYNPGAGNTELALTYVSFGRWQLIGARSNGDVGVTEHFFTWGLRTSDTLRPRTGTGQYEGLVFGTAAGTVAGDPIWALGGTSIFNVDFARSSFAGSLALNGRETSGATRDFGALTIGSGSVLFNSSLRAEVRDRDTLVGAFEGGLFGPQANELGGSFTARIPGASADRSIFIAGVTLAKRKP